MYFEDALKLINGLGRFQWLMIFITSMAWIPIAFNVMVPIFITATPSFLCAVNRTGSDLHNNSSHTDSQQCSLNLNITNSTNEACTKWIYDESVFGSTIVSEWDLVCSRRWFVSVSTSVYMAGQMVGLLPIGIAADKLGRRKSIMVSSIGMTLLMYAAPLSPNIYIFMVIRFFTAFFAMGYGTVTFGYALEIVDEKYRMLAAVLNGMPFSFGIMILVGVTYFSRNWQITMYILAGISTLVTLLTISLPESARWLYAVHDLKRGEAILRKMAKINGTQDKLDKDLKIEVMGKQKANIMDLVRTPKMRKRTIIACFLWFIGSFSYYGLFLNASNLPLNIYVDITLGGILGIVGNIIGYFILTTLGRKVTGITSFVLAGGFLLVTLAFQPGDMTISILSLIGRMITSISFAIAYIYSAELAPTVIRSNSLSLGSVFARLGAIISPYMLIANEVHPAISSIVFGVLSIFGGMLIFLLPETKGTRLPDTIEDVENGKSIDHIMVKEVYTVTVDNSGVDDPLDQAGVAPTVKI